MYTEKIRIYPNKSQRDIIDKILCECHFLYNHLLDCVHDLYEATKITPRKYDYDYFTKMLNLKYIPAQVRQNVCKRVFRSYERFFNKISGYPKYKSYKEYCSFTYPQFGNRTISLHPEKNKIHFGKIGKIKAIFSRPINGIPKTCTLKKMKSGKYYAFIQIEDEQIQQIPLHREKNVGIDLGLKNFATLSTGIIIKPPRYFKQYLHKICRAQRRLSRKISGSNNFEKHRKFLAKIYEHITNKRTDFHYKLAFWLTHKFDNICVEKLKTQFMIKRKKNKKNPLAFTSADCGLFTFLLILHHMGNKYSSKIIDVDPYNTTQQCSKCGSIVPKTLNDRQHICPNCGFDCDRDLNAALNILKKGLKLECGTVGTPGTITLVEIN